MKQGIRLNDPWDEQEFYMNHLGSYAESWYTEYHYEVPDKLIALAKKCHSMAVKARADLAETAEHMECDSAYRKSLASPSASNVEIDHICDVIMPQEKLEQGTEVRMTTMLGITYVATQHLKEILPAMQIDPHTQRT